MSSDALYKKVFVEGKFLLPAEEKIIREQIHKNTCLIDETIERLDLIINREGHQRHERFVNSIRERLYILMAENDTFRKVYWQHYLLEEIRQSTHLLSLYNS